VRPELSLAQWSTATKGQVFSPQRVSQSALNIEKKDRLARPWDVHAERLLQCTSCHFSVNNPAFALPASGSQPGHLKFEPRRLTVGEYIERPSHQLAKGHTAQGTLARHLDGTMRRCEDCHDATNTHGWLPYREAHFARLSCEACHIPQVYAPAVQQVDWTLPTPSGDPRVQWRGLKGDPADATAAIQGFRPVLVPSKGVDNCTKLVPHNLVSAWYWVEGGATPRPVRLADLRAAILQNGKYHPDVVAVLGIRDGQPSTSGPFVLDTPEKVAVVRRRLETVGVVQPHIEAEVQPYSLHHGVGPAKWATRQCETCHKADSRLGEDFVLSSSVPGGVLPQLVGDCEVALTGHLQTNSDGGLSFRPEPRQASLYVLGHNRWIWVNALGGLSLAFVMVGAAVHAGLRVRASHARKSVSQPITMAEEPEEST
jgi:hypothetical protein